MDSVGNYIVVLSCVTVYNCIIACIYKYVSVSCDDMWVLCLLDSTATSNI